MRYVWFCFMLANVVGGLVMGRLAFATTPPESDLLLYALGHAFMAAAFGYEWWRLVKRA